MVTESSTPSLIYSIPESDSTSISFLFAEIREQNKHWTKSRTHSAKSHS